MSERRKTATGRFSLFSWLAGGAPTVDEANDTTTKSAPELSEPVNQVIDVETIRAAVSMRKLWSTYHDLSEKKQIEILEEVVKLFVQCVTSCENDLFKNA